MNSIEVYTPFVNDLVGLMSSIDPYSEKLDILTPEQIHPS